MLEDVQAPLGSRSLGACFKGQIVSRMLLGIFADALDFLVGHNPRALPLASNVVYIVQHASSNHHHEVKK